MLKATLPGVIAPEAERLMSDSDKKRRYDRIETPTITLQIAEGERSRRRFLRDLSQGGVYVRTRDTRPVGTEVTLELNPPGWESTIKVRGEVVRVAHVSDEDGDDVPVGMGIQFKDVGPKNAELLAELLSEYRATSPQLEEETTLPDEIDTLQREVRALRMRLREARAMIDALHSEVETLEDDDESNRSIIERLAVDKKQLKSDLEERETALVQQLQDKHARELRTILDGYEKRRRRSEENYIHRIEELDKENTTLRREVDRASDRATHAESDFRELHGDLQRVIEEAHASAQLEVEAAVAEEKARSEELEQRLNLTEERLQKVRKKERELRRLVAVMSGDEPDEDESRD